MRAPAPDAFDGVVETNLGAAIALVLVFILIGGVFAGAEIALVSLRESQITQIAKRGARGERVANLARDPNRFLAAVQIGVTVAGFFSAAFGASALAPHLAPVLTRMGLGENAAAGTAMVLLTLGIAYLSLVLGELVPKRFALQRSSAIAYAVAPPLDKFATLMRPVIWLLSVSTDVVVRALGGDPSAVAEEMSDEELRDLVVGHKGLAEEKRRIMHEVFDAGSITVREVMRPRQDVDFLDVRLTIGEASRVVAGRPHSRYPVTGDGVDDVVGFVHVRDVMLALAHGGDQSAPIRQLVRELLAVPASNDLLPTLAMMRGGGQHIALVVDEYGGTDGIVTVEDMVEELLGEIRDDDERAGAAPDVERGPDGHLLADASLILEDFAERVGVTLPDGDYETVGGFVLDRLGRMAQVGDTVEVGDVVLEVAQMAGLRIERVRVRRPGAERLS